MYTPAFIVYDTDYYQQSWTSFNKTHNEAV